MSGRQVTFAFLREGRSDDGLIPHLRTLIIRFGATEAIGQARDYRGTPLNKLRLLRAEGVSTDLVFVHRDADRARPEDRRAEILLERLDIDGPVRQLAAWRRLEADIQAAVVILAG